MTMLLKAIEAAGLKWVEWRGNGDGAAFVEPLGIPGASRVLAIGGASANAVLTATVRRISLHATVAAYYKVGTGEQVALATSHYIGAGERIDIAVPSNANIAVIRAVGDGTLYISELV